MSIHDTRPIANVLARLSNVKPMACDRWIVSCPNRNHGQGRGDLNPSLSVTEAEDCTVLFNCFAGCTSESIVSAIGLSMADLFPPNNNDSSVSSARLKTPRNPAQSFPTVNDVIAFLLQTDRLRGGQITRHIYHESFVVLRFDFPDERDKTFRPIHCTPDGWRIGGPAGLLPLYRLSELDGADTVYVCEGEKACDAARSIALSATTSAHGAKSAQNTDWSPLARKQVVILPDNNAPGRKYAETVARRLWQLGCKVRIVELSGLPDGGDIADLVEACSENQDATDIACDVRELAEKSPPSKPTGEDTNTMSRKWIPFPVDALPEPLRKFVKQGARAIGCDESMIALPALAACAAAIGTTRRIQLKQSWCEFPIVWCAIVSESGTLKSPAMDYAIAALRKHQAEKLRDYEDCAKQYDKDRLKYEADLVIWKRKKGDRGEPPDRPDPPECERYVVSDTTIEALVPILLANGRGVLLARDELSGWFGGFNQYKAGRGGDIPAWLECHRGGTVIVDRKTGAQRISYVPSAAVSIFGTIQPRTLQRGLIPEFFENGLAARLLLAMPPRGRKRWTDADTSPSVFKAYLAMLNELLTLKHTANMNGDPISVDVPLSAGAREAWIVFYNEFADKQAESQGDLAAAFSKIEGYAARFALVHHFIRGVYLPDFDSEAIGAESVEFGVTLARWFAHETERIYCIFAETDEGRNRRELVEFIRTRGGSVTARELQRGGPCFKTANEAREALDDLVARGLGVWKSPKPSSKGGHPATQFQLADSTDPDATPAHAAETTGSVSVSSVTAPHMQSPPTMAAGEDSPGDLTREAWREGCGDEAGRPPTNSPDPPEPERV